MAISPTETIVARTDLGASPGLGAERRFYAGMAVFFFLTALAGFVPSSIGKIAAVQAGQRPPFPLVLHLHAVIMGLWLCLILAQSLLVARGRVALHRRLGVAGFVLAPAVLVIMLLMTRAAWMGVLAIPPGMMAPEALAGTKAFVADILLGQIVTLVLFPVFIGWALAVRRTDPDTHKRLMLLGTLLPLLAAIDRATSMVGLTTIPESGDSLYLCLVIWIAPALVFDLLRRGRVHRAYVLGLAAIVPFFIASHFLWGTPTWQATAPAIMRLVGVTNW